MPEANLAAFNLEGMDPAQLEQRRRAIVQSMLTDYRGYNDPNVPMALLQELSAITGALRNKTARPPKRAAGSTPKKANKKPTTADIADMFS